MKKRLFLIFAIFSFLTAFCFADDSTQSTEAGKSTETTETTETKESADSSEVVEIPGDVEEEIINIKGQEFEQAESFGEFIHSLDFCFDIGPAMYINAKSKLLNPDGYRVSGPSPVFDPVTIGVLWPNYTFISMEPSVSYFSMYYLWYDGMALPAEIENRTASTLSFMFNIPAVFQLYLSKVRFQIYAGLGVLARFGILAGGVKESDYGYTGSAGGDLKEINNWFWKNGRFLYISTGFSCLFNLYGNVKAGPVCKIYIPVSVFSKNDGFQGTIIDFGLKISL